MTCEWFALCTRPARWLVAHPVLGEVPTCEQCVEQRKLRERVVGAVQQ